MSSNRREREVDAAVEGCDGASGDDALDADDVGRDLRAVPVLRVRGAGVGALNSLSVSSVIPSNTGGMVGVGSASLGRCLDSGEAEALRARDERSMRSGLRGGDSATSMDEWEERREGGGGRELQSRRAREGMDTFGARTRISLSTILFGHSRAPFLVVMSTQPNALDASCSEINHRY